MQLSHFFQQMVKHEASDLYLTTGAPPSAKIQGNLKIFSQDKFAPDDVKELAYNLMTPEQIQEFEVSPEMNLAVSEPQVGRFRVNIFRQRNQVAMVVRRIAVEIPLPETLNLPSVLKQVIMSKRGLILFVGGTGSGKSTSLASLIDYRNANSSGHIITIEDPIEFMHQHKKSIVNQREVGIDTDSYEDALKNTLRQAPDVIMIGEIRDQKTMEHAMAFAETGHLAVSTLHANNANQAFDRIVNFFPDERRKQALMDLSLNTCAIVSQRLIPGKDGKRVAATEILTGTPMIKDLILKGEFHKLKEIMEKSANAGMQTFDSALIQLFMQGKIDEEEAIKNADSQNNVRLKISLYKDGLESGSFSHSTLEREVNLDEMADSPSVVELAHKGEFHKLKLVADRSLRGSNKNYDDLLVELYKRNHIAINDMMLNALDGDKIKQRLTNIDNKNHHASFTLTPLNPKAK